jgi:hypothetical protein
MKRANLSTNPISKASLPPSGKDGEALEETTELLDGEGTIPASSGHISDASSSIHPDTTIFSIANVEVKGYFKAISMNRTIAVEPIPFRLPEELKIYNSRPSNPYFVPRKQLLDDLFQVFGCDEEDGLSFQGLRSVVLSAFHGLSGVGKTQLALHYFNEPKKPYRFRGWFQADDKETLQREYLSLAYEAGLVDPESREDKQPEIIVRRVKDWLSRNPGWLLVYDNASNYDEVEDFLPGQGGDVLITSKSSAWIGKHIFVSVMELDEAVALVKKIYEPENDSEDGDIIALVEMLGRLPLAIAQAAAYIKVQQQNIATYLSRYEMKRLEMLSDDTLRKCWSQKEHEPVAVTWLLTIEELRKTVPDAESLLQFCAYFSNRDIPNYLLRACLYINPQEEETQASEKRYPLQAFWQLILAIRQYSLLEINKQQDTVSIHQLVQTVIQEPLSQEEKQRIILNTVSAINEEYPEKEPSMKDMQRRRNLIPHMQSVKQYSEKVFEQSKEMIEQTVELPLLLCLVDVYSDIGDVHRQKALLERALAIKEAHYDKDHWQLVATLVNLANAHGDLGDAHRQKALLERALAIQEAHYGKDHWQVAITLTNLGETHNALCIPKEAKALLERALAIQEAHYDKDCWQLAATLVNLANAHGFLGDAHQQKALLERALAIQEAHYGKDHWQVAITLTNLGETHNALCIPKEAKALLERALAIKEAHYDKDHWQLAATLVNLANAYGSLGDAHQQKALLERALIIDEAHYGKDHWQLAATLVNLANAHGDLGNVHQKKALLERALTIQEAHYGKDHWQVAITLTSLGGTHNALCIPKEAKALLERALTIQEAYYGKDHWQVAITLTNLANAHGDLGNAHQQKALLERALAIKEAHYGKDHWQLATTLVNLANAHGDLGDAHQQKALLERALIIDEAHYGKDHWQLAATLVNLANAHGFLGDAHQQKALLERALAIQEAHYGKDHWQLAATLVNLANAHGFLGDAHQKKALLERALAIEKQHYGEQHGEVGYTLYFLAKTYYQTKNYFEAFQYSQHAKQIFQNAKGFGENHPWTRTSAKFADFLEQIILQVISQSTQNDLDAAQQALQVGDIDKAIKHYEQHITTNPEEAEEAYHNLACCYHMRGDHEKADETFKKAVKEKPNSGVWCEYGHFLFTQSRYEEAIEPLQQAKALAIDNRQLWYGFAEKPFTEPGIQKEIEIVGDKGLTIDAALLSRYLLVNASHQLNQNVMKEKQKSSEDQEISGDLLVKMVTEKAKESLEEFVEFVKKTNTPLAYQLLRYTYQNLGDLELAEAILLGIEPQSEPIQTLTEEKMGEPDVTLNRNTQEVIQKTSSETEIQRTTLSSPTQTRYSFHHHDSSSVAPQKNEDDEQRNKLEITSMEM